MGLLNRKRRIPSPVAEPAGFQLYFAGSQNKVAETYLRENGANRLASQLIDRNVINGWIEGRKEGLCKGHLFIDSGAFSAHTRDAEVDVDAYIDYLNSLDSELHIFAQVDKIPGVFRKTKTKEQLLEAPELSWQNYLYMRERLLSPKKLLPIFHQGEDYKWLENMLLWVDDNGDYIPYIGISPANDQPVKEKEKFIDKCFKIIKASHNPDVKTHAFGMTSLYILEAYPFTSADSTSWIMNGANGSIMTKYGSITVSDARRAAPEHICRMSKEAQKEIAQYAESRGYTIQGLAEDYKQRVIFNIKFLMEWARNYKYTPSSVKRKTLF